MKTSTTSMIDHMRDFSKKQAAVHTQIAASATTYEGNGSLTIHAYLIAGSLTGTFNINGACYTCKAIFPGTGWANGTVEGTISLLIDPQLLVGSGDGFTLTCTTKDLTMTIYNSGVAVGTFSGGEGISGGGAFAGSSDWSNC